jgi:cytosine/adenosine deaminase-related metal-dependent hydrolase
MRPRSVLSVLLLAFITIGLCAAASLQAAVPQENKTAPKRTAIRAGRLIDTRNGTAIQNAVILIEGDKITAAGAGLEIPAGYDVVDLSRATVLPGLIDCHTHLTVQPGNYYDDLFRKSPIAVAVTAHVYARRTLEAGFTTVWDMGAGEFIDVAGDPLKDVSELERVLFVMKGGVVFKAASVSK